MRPYHVAHKERPTPIGIRQLTIGNPLTHPLPRGGTDHIALYNLFSNTLTEHYRNSAKLDGRKKIAEN
jgi:hypothetical protein